MGKLGTDSFHVEASFAKKSKERAVGIVAVERQGFAEWLEREPAHVRAWVESTGFRPRAGAHCLLPGESGRLERVVVLYDDATNFWELASLPGALPRGTYAVKGSLGAELATSLCLGWALGSYRFERYKSKKKELPTLVWPDDADTSRVLALAEGVAFCRDLITTPAEDMGPEELTAAGHALAKRHGAKFHAIVGDKLIQKGFPAIHAVGRASSRPPVLFDLRWGKAKHPRVTLVGKGVCFDTGGLDIKPANYMLLMKKDMGGAALVLGLAHVIMSQNLPVQLRVLVPAVENSVSGNALRPLDVVQTRKGLRVEIGNTDAEGRVVLADALAEAESENPDLIIDAATLTGAARVALGVGLPALFARKDGTADQLMKAGLSAHDPVWRLPLFEPYRRMIDSQIADLTNNSESPYAGAITAALFLAEFMSKDRDWIHLDTMAYNTSARPGRPVGGEALGLFALSRMLEERYAGKARASGSTESTEAAVAPTKGPRATERVVERAKSPRKGSKAIGDRETPSRVKAPRPKKGSARRPR